MYIKKLNILEIPVLIFIILTFSQNATGQVAMEWVARYNGYGAINDSAFDLAVDSSGNSYVTGESWGGGSDQDICTIKYDTAGAELWVRRYNGPGNLDDKPNAITVDPSSNVYVTGACSGDGTNYDIVTIKYASDGTMLWVALYNGSGNDWDHGDDITVDNLGNVYVTGSSFETGEGYNCTTIKYDRNGNELWVASYDGSGSGTDTGNSIVVDGSGNVYVTGRSESTTGSDYITLKYNNSGIQQWSVGYNGLADGYDAASDVIVDSLGNVYVTGTSFDLTTNDDYATVKYDSDGTQVWVARYDGPDSGVDRANSMVMDAAGNIVVTGESTGTGSDTDCATIKYDDLGNELWVSRYNGSGNGQDTAQKISVEPSGNIFVTGTSTGLGTKRDYVVLSYDAAGTERWVNIYDGPGNDNDQAFSVDVDSAGQVYVTGRSIDTGFAYVDYATLKYSNAGTRLWVTRFNGPGPGSGSDEPFAITVDDTGNVYVTGRSFGRGTGHDYATLKYDSTGSQQWAARYNGPADGDDTASAIAVDTVGNVYVTGSSSGISLDDDYYTIKYGPTGTVLWEDRYDGTGNGMDDARDIVFNEMGMVCVTGQSTDRDTLLDIRTLMYSSADGSILWQRRYNGSASGDDVGIAVTMDAFQNSYVTGSSWGGSTLQDYVTLTYDSLGTQRWVSTYDGPAKTFDKANDVAVDAGGNVYVTGASSGLGTRLDYATIKYRADGSELWVVRYNGPVDGYDEPVGLVVDSAGNVYVTGTSDGGVTSDDIVTIKYDAGGSELWIKRYDGGTGDVEIASAITVDASGNIYVTGYGYWVSYYPDFLTIKYDASGNQLWVHKYNGSGNATDQVRDICLDLSGNVYITGTSFGYGSSNDFVTVKLTQYSGVPISDNVLLIIFLFFLFSVLVSLYGYSLK